MSSQPSGSAVASVNLRAKSPRAARSHRILEGPRLGPVPTVRASFALISRAEERRAPRLANREKVPPSQTKANRNSLHPKTVGI